MNMTNNLILLLGGFTLVWLLFGVLIILIILLLDR